MEFLQKSLPQHAPTLVYIVAGHGKRTVGWNGPEAQHKSILTVFAVLLDARLNATVFFRTVDRAQDLSTFCRSSFSTNAPYPGTVRISGPLLIHLC